MKAAFFKGTHAGIPGLYNRFVRLWDSGPYSHCELVFANNLCGSASFMDGGVRMKYIDLDPDKWDVIDMPDFDEKFAFDWFLQHDGKAYNIWGNIRFLLGFVPASNDKFFCSEAIASALGFPDAWRFSPNTINAVLKKKG